MNNGAAGLTSSRCGVTATVVWSCRRGDDLLDGVTLIVVTRVCAVGRIATVDEMEPGCRRLWEWFHAIRYLRERDYVAAGTA